MLTLRENLAFLRAKTRGIFCLLQVLDDDGGAARGQLLQPAQRDGVQGVDRLHGPPHLQPRRLGELPLRDPPGRRHGALHRALQALSALPGAAGAGAKKRSHQLFPLCFGFIGTNSNSMNSIRRAASSGRSGVAYAAEPGANTR